MLLFTWLGSIFNNCMKSTTVNTGMSTNDNGPWYQEMNINVFPSLLLISHFPVNTGIAQLHNKNIFQNKVNQHILNSFPYKP